MLLLLRVNTKAVTIVIICFSVVRYRLRLEKFYETFGENIVESFSEDIWD